MTVRIPLFNFMSLLVLSHKRRKRQKCILDEVLGLGPMFFYALIECVLIPETLLCHCAGHGLQPVRLSATIVLYLNSAIARIRIIYPDCCCNSSLAATTCGISW